MDDDSFCSPDEAQKVQASARREMFPNAPDQIPCKLCRSMMPNPVINHGVFANWCIPCMQSKLSKRTVRRMGRRREKAIANQGEVKDKIRGVNFEDSAKEEALSEFSTIEGLGGKPQLTLSSYLSHG